MNYTEIATALAAVKANADAKVAKAVAAVAKTSAALDATNAPLADAVAKVASAEAELARAEADEKLAAATVTAARSKLSALGRQEQEARSGGCVVAIAVATGKAMEQHRSVASAERKLAARREFARGRERALNRAIALTLPAREEVEEARAEAEKAERHLAAAKAEAEKAAWAAAKALGAAEFASRRSVYVSEEEARRREAAAKAVAYIRKTAEVDAANRGATLPDADQLGRVNAWRKAHGLRQVAVLGV